MRFKGYIIATGFLLLVAFVVLNVLAYNHAHAMMHYADSGDMTKKPEKLKGLAKLSVLLFGINVPRPEKWRTPEDLKLDYRTLQLPVEGGVELEAWHVPAPGSPMMAILFHGYASEKSALLNEARILAEWGHDVLLVDFRGSGGSSESITTLGHLEAADVTAAYRFVREKWPEKNILLLGQSMGAAAILRAIAVDEIEPDRIVLEAVFDSMLNATCNRFDAMRVPSFPNAQLLLFWGGRQVGFNCFRHNPVDYAARVSCPALFLHGAEDPRATPVQARRVFENVPGPKEFVEFDQMGHGSIATEHPDKWRSAVAAFIKNISS